MSEEQLKAFLTKVKGDSNLKEKLKAAKSHLEIVTIAKEHGYEFTVDKIILLSDEELENVAGGTNWSTELGGNWCQYD
ncbi:nif11-like leader peptide domain protein [Synechococcus sp. BIOS-E4-1]|uniref:Nif11-like leader peptide family natural product precursor n=1 Tax=Synechococcus sp. BIOS-E4-1 TaxID=1400864 RepID=UPI0016459639|nr:Nif11-like leader peptide family natural product precursor [Synechococcus sp. BIOS-E4-1]QNI55910.1 nif11-like leader peptide domain protein [Synechococcus sp. BIOS-E4-1]